MKRSEKKIVHFKVDYEGLTQLIRNFWAEGEYTQALAIMIDSGIETDNAKDVIRGKLKMAQYPGGKEEAEDYLVPDTWKPKLASCLWGQYPDPDDHKFFRMINRYGVKPLCEARNDIEQVINDLRRTVYSPDKIRLVNYLRKERKYADEIYTFFNLPFPETVEVDCEPDQVLPYFSPWADPNFSKSIKEGAARTREKRDREFYENQKIVPKQITKEEAKPKKAQIVIDNTHIVYLEVHSWIGTDFEASHYYGELKDRNKTVQLKTKLTRRQAARLNRDKEFKDFRAGDETTGFNSKELLIQEALKQWKIEFPDSTLLVEGSNSVGGPQTIIEGPEELKKIVNPLYERAEELGWYNYTKHEAEVDDIHNQWRKAMLKFGYAKELQL